MLKNRIIPCLDVKNGRVVKWINFVDLKDAGDPVEQASIYSNGGADEICFLDITASHEKRKAMLEVIKKTTQNCFIPITVGGGVSNLEDINNLLLSGADKVSINTAAVKNMNFIKEASKKFGAQCIVVAVDARAADDTFSSWEVVTYGGRERTGIDVIEWVNTVKEYGAGEILLTSMDRDGTKEGFDNKLTKSVSSSVSIPIIASGGVGTLQHLVDGIKEGGAEAVLAASIFHYSEFTVQEAKQAMLESGLEVRN